MTQLNSKSIQSILQEALSKDGDFLKEMVRMLLQEIAGYFFIRVNHQVVSCPILLTVGVDQNGHRKIRGVDLAFEESYQSYKDHFNRLKEKGLKQVDLTISDEHKGLLRAQQEVFPHTPQQRCIVH